MTGTVRSSALIRAQPNAVRAEIRRRYETKLERWRTGETSEVPCAVKLGAATRT